MAVNDNSWETGAFFPNCARVEQLMGNRLQKLLFLLLVTATGGGLGFQRAADPEVLRWEQQARNIKIVRDDWGIAHVYGKTDADAVFGALYAQAEDDFFRIETNYINAMGRLAEAEGESKNLSGSANEALHRS